MKGKTALITGSTVGLGLATASELAAQGCNIIMTGFGKPDVIEGHRSELEKKYGVGVKYIPADLQRPAEIESMVADGLKTFGTIDILINNAAVRHKGPVETFPTADWDQDIAVNLSAPFHLIRLTLPGMRRANWGRIVNLSSNMGILGRPGRIGYVTTKTALLGMTRAIAMETHGTNITCNAICPSAMLGEQSAGLINDIMTSEGISYEAATEKFLAGRKRDRFVTTVPAMVLFLCGETGKDMTGATIPIDMGSVAGVPGAAI